MVKSAYPIDVQSYCRIKKLAITFSATFFFCHHHSGAWSRFDMFLTTCSNVCSHHLYLGIEWSIKYASVLSLCLGRANESRFLTVGGFKKLLYYFLL